MSVLGFCCRYEGIIDEYDASSGMYHISYDDGDVRWYDMSKKVFRILETSTPGVLNLPPAVDMVRGFESFALQF